MIATLARHCPPLQQGVTPPTYNRYKEACTLNNSGTLEGGQIRILSQLDDVLRFLKAISQRPPTAAAERAGAPDLPTRPPPPLVTPDLHSLQFSVRPDTSEPAPSELGQWWQGWSTP